jgi:hypothetical protein
MINKALFVPKIEKPKYHYRKRHSFVGGFKFIGTNEYHRLGTGTLRAHLYSSVRGIWKPDAPSLPSPHAAIFIRPRLHFFPIRLTTTASACVVVPPPPPPTVVPPPSHGHCHTLRRRAGPRCHPEPGPPPAT